MRASQGLAIALLLVAAACGKDAPTDNNNNGGTGPIGGTGPGTGGSTSDAIEVLDNSFSPNATTVPTGSTVTWTWMGVNPHSIIFTTAGPSNSTSQTSGSFSQTFNSAGVFNYACGVHGSSMSGKVTVANP